MNKSEFDAGSFIEVNLADGTISSRENDRLALISTEVLGMLPASESVFHAAATWGKVHGGRLAQQIVSGGEEMGVETLAAHLCGTLASLGLGRIRLEIRGDALLFRSSPEGSPGIRTLLQGFLSGYLTHLIDRPFTVLDMGEAEGERLFWAANPEAAQVAQVEIENGADPLSVLETAMQGRPSC